MTILRPYQQVIADEIPVRLARDGSVLVYSPMRSGKSKIISYTTERIVQSTHNGGKVALVLTHRDKIYKQLIEHCNGIAIAADTDHVFIQRRHCYVAMKQTLINRPHILSQLQALRSDVILLVDEGHVGDFNKIFDLLPQALRIGFSATPAWKWAKFLPTYYKSLIHGPQISQLIASGNFVPVRYYEMVSDLEGLRKQSNGEYTEASQFDVFDRAKLYDGLFDELAKFTFNKCAIFCSSKKSADRLALQFVQDGRWRSVVYYSGKQSYDLAKFTTLHTADVLITVRSLGTGWDYPQLDFTVLWCAMGSLPAFLQTGARPCTPHPGKNYVTVLDFGGNNSRFGGSLDRQALVMDRDWNALWLPPEKPPRTAGGVAAVKNCPRCDFMMSALARACPNCGYPYPEAEVLLKVGELVQIQEQEAQQTAQVAAQAGRRISTLSPAELALFAKERDKKSYAIRIARSQELKKQGFLQPFGQAMGYKPSWVNRQLSDLAELQMYDPDIRIDFNDMLIK